MSIMHKKHINTHFSYENLKDLPYAVPHSHMITEDISISTQGPREIDAKSFHTNRHFEY